MKCFFAWVRVLIWTLFALILGGIYWCAERAAQWAAKKSAKAEADWNQAKR